MDVNLHDGSINIIHAHIRINLFNILHCSVCNVFWLKGFESTL